MYEVIATSDLVILLISDGAQAKLYKVIINSYRSDYCDCDWSKLSILLFYHPFNISLLDVCMPIIIIFAICISFSHA